jgi:hypothetical protein
MRLQVNRAAGDPEGLGCSVLSDSIATIGATEASLDAGLIGVAVRCGSLSKSQRDQQNRYNDQQEYIFHGILLGSSTGGSLEFHLGFNFAFDPYAELSRVVYRSSIRPGNLEHPEWNNTNSTDQGFYCLFKRAHIRFGSESSASRSRLFSAESGSAILAGARRNCGRRNGLATTIRVNNEWHSPVTTKSFWGVHVAACVHPRATSGLLELAHDNIQAGFFVG